MSNLASRGNWGTRIGFIMAATGSAIGLGNIWKFPYITGVYGGGAFVFVYLLCVLIVGLPLMITEFIIGRRSQKNPVGAFRKLHHKKSPWQLTGWLGVASGFIILSFYSIIAGWALAYIFKSIVGFTGSAEAIQSEFVALVTDSGQSIMWHTIFMGLTVAIVIGGVQEGIERWSKILMPLLLALLLGLMYYGLVFTHGGSAALSFLFNPDFSSLSTEGVLSALGHAFFTLSLGMGAMITYGSYMKREVNILRDAVTISFLDTLIALIAGVAIYSMVFNYGLEPAAGPGLIFQTLPVLFAETGPIVSVAFFVLLSFAALTSAISLLEVVVSYFVDERKWSRVKATLTLGFLIYLTGLLSAIATITIPFRGKEQGFLDIFDFITTNYMLPIGGLLTCLFIAWVMPDKDRSDEFGSSGGFYRTLILVLRFITPVAVLIIILHGLELLPFMEY
ncbi:MAG: sodium-dependent transporter [Candidatus Zixiibacteriota bacterium]|nr:MAG: sodium-dependent transporter [candidate division Zixibacteria bacterium]HHI03906.1 sodium-dependent transporter [candidate division Zixibacteria bacterium]